MKLKPREYQLSIFKSIMQNGNTLVVLPTGLGKTLIALMLIKEKMGEGRCLFLTPTKPLAKQHYKSIQEILSLGDDKVTLVSGEVTPKKREKEYAKKVIVSTPQTIRNDIQKKRLDADFSICIFDECHRAVGDYAYTFIAEALPDSLKVGLTASPGGRSARIKEVLGNLGITNVEIRDSKDSDVEKYVFKSNIRWIPVELSPLFKLIKKELDALTSKHARKLSTMGFPPPLKHKGKFIELRQRILKIRSPMKYPAIITYSVLLNLIHMTELLETQGMYPLKKYLEKMKAKTSKSAKRLLKEPGMERIQELCESDEEHPKMGVLIDQVKSLDGKKMIVFAHYRDQIAKIEHELMEHGIEARKFVGKRDGFSKKLQEKTIADFREGDFNVLVASSIGEEGLDIPAVDAVIFYEPVPSEIRSIQRRGRAGRFSEGEIIILMTRGTRDEFYYWASRKKEAKMKSILKGMQNKGGTKKKRRKRKLEGQTRISHFV